MATKAKKKSAVISISDDRYSNLNLNQNQICPVFKPVPTMSKQNHDEIAESSLRSGTSKEKWRYNGLQKSPVSYSNNSKTAKKKKDKKDDSSSNKRKSTLSLHITAFENAVETVASDTIKKLGNKKQVFNLSTLVVQNPFEFPRQQNDKVSEPEVYQHEVSGRGLMLPPPPAPTIDEQQQQQQTELPSMTNAISQPPVLEEKPEKTEKSGYLQCKRLMLPQDNLVKECKAGVETIKYILDYTRYESIHGQVVGTKMKIGNRNYNYDRLQLAANLKIIGIKKVNGPKMKIGVVEDFNGFECGNLLHFIGGREVFWSVEYDPIKEILDGKEFVILKASSAAEKTAICHFISLSAKAAKAAEEEATSTKGLRLPVGQQKIQELK